MLLFLFLRLNVLTLLHVNIFKVLYYPMCKGLKNNLRVEVVYFK